MKFPVPMLLLTLGLPAALQAAHGTARLRTSLVADEPFTGKVLDENGAGLPGVTVRVKGGAAGTATDDQGNFTLANVPADATLLVSYVGYKAQEIKAARTGSVTVRLVPAQGQLNEVVVVGYGTQQRKNLLAPLPRWTPAIRKRCRWAASTRSYRARYQACRFRRPLACRARR